MSLLDGASLDGVKHPQEEVGEEDDLRRDRRVVEVNLATARGFLNVPLVIPGIAYILSG